MEIDQYNEKPIPNLDKKREKKLGYRNYPIENIDEEYVDVLTLGIAGENYYNKKFKDLKKESGAISELILRKSIADKLIAINKKLNNVGLELFVIDAFRPIQVQNYMHDVHAPSQLQERHPEWSKDRIMEEVSKFWAFGGTKNGEIDPLSPPPHSTGAAIDLSIRKIGASEQLNMNADFDGLSDKSFTDYYEDSVEKNELANEAQGNRRLLYWIMIESGFENNPTEWWHFSYGDQMWAKLLDKKCAIYSNISTK